MKNIKCKNCGEDVDSSAKSCEKCGKDPRNFFEKHKALTIIGAIIMLAIIISAFGGGENNNQNSTSTGTGSNKKPTQTVAPKKTEYKAGEEYKNKYVNIKYISKNEDFKKYNKYSTVKKGHKIIEAAFEFQNVGKTDQYVSAYKFNCYADGYDCEAFWSVEGSAFSATLSTEKKAKGKVYFQVPKDAKKITLEYDNNVWIAEDKVVFIVK